MKTTHIALCLGILTGCAGLIGVPDLTFDENAGQGSPDGSSNPDGSSINPDGGPNPTNDGGKEAAPPCDESKLATDPSHCGRCGHDCLGGICTAGKCESVILQGGLQNPVDLTTDATNVYVTSVSNGTLLRVAKDGSGNTVLASGYTKARGVTLGGGKIFWSSGDFGGDGGDGYWGGVWGCTLPGCTDTAHVTSGEYAYNVRFANGALFFAESNGGVVTRVNPDGSGRIELASSLTQPFSVAVDATHVYYQAKTGNLERAPVSGGAAEDFGPLDPGGGLGFTVVDNERVYWAYVEEVGDTGHVYSTLKSPAGSPTIQYGTNNKNSTGVAVDATMVYWTNAGTYDGSGNNNKDGEVLACPKEGCGAGPIVLQQGLNNPGAITVDSEAIYFATFGTSQGSADGEVRRIARP